MPEFIFYATKNDADVIRKWINSEPDIAWINKIKEVNNEYFWKASKGIDVLQEQDYALWHMKSGPLNIPSGKIGLADAVVADPFKGWSQTMPLSGATSPWFGGNLPGPYSFRFAELGREVPGSLARSGFSWLEDRYKSIGKAAHPDAKKWWKRLRQFLERSSTQSPWITPAVGKRTIMAFVFPEAQAQIDQGRHKDINP